MEALLANERELEIQIDTYKTQVSSVLWHSDLLEFPFSPVHS